MASILTLRSISRKGAVIVTSSSPSSKWINSARMVGAAAWIHTKSSQHRDSSKIGTSPLLMLPPVIEEGKNMVYKMYSLAENRVVSINSRKDDLQQEEFEFDDKLVVGSSHGWLATYNKRTHDLFLSNPHSQHHQIIKLPSFLTLPTAKHYLAKTPDSRCIERVIISSPPEEEEDCRVICETKMTWYPHNYGDTGLVFCCPSRSTEWTPIGSGLYPNYRALAYSTKQKLLFCLTSVAMIEVWDLRDLRYPRVCFEEEYDDVSTYWEKNVRPRSQEEKWRLHEVCRRRKYLVFSEQSNELFVVTRHIMERAGPNGSYVEKIIVGPERNVHLDHTLPEKTIDFHVKKITGWEQGEERKRCESLNGLSFFIGKNNGFALPADEYPGLKPNSIYFTDNEINCSKDCDTGHVSIFDYQNRTLSPFYYPCDSQSKSIVPSAMWFTPSSSL